MNIDAPPAAIELPIATPDPHTNPIVVESLAMAYPPYVLGQEDVLAYARRIFAERPQMIERMAKSYDNAGVKHRNSCVPIAWYQSAHGWPERAQLYEENALALLVAAARDALSAADVRPADVAATVTVSSTGIVTPSLDSLLQGPLGLAATVQRLPIFGLGCAGGVIGLARAAAFARSMPGRWVLFLCTELCGLTFRAGDLSKSNVIATTLFGDGAAALLLRAPAADGMGQESAADRRRDKRSRRAIVRAWGEHTWPETRDIMGWRVEDDGLAVIFSRDIPTLVRDCMRPVVDDFLSTQGLARGDLDGFIVHPGGEKVLLAMEEAFGLGAEELADARAVLENHGNMSSVTVLAVLERALAQGRTGRHLMLALGPGFSLGLCLVDLV